LIYQTNKPKEKEEPKITEDKNQVCPGPAAANANKNKRKRIAP
jgi:translation initiation factor IF-2